MLEKTGKTGSSKAYTGNPWSSCSENILSLQHIEMVRAQPNCLVQAQEILISMIAFALCMETSKALQISKTLNSLLDPNTASLPSKLFRFCKRRQWGLCSRKMQVSQQINKTNIDPGDKHFSLGHWQCGFSYQTQVILVNRAGKFPAANSVCTERAGTDPPTSSCPSFPTPGAQNNALEWCSSFSKTRVSSRVFQTSCSPIHSPPCDSSSNIHVFPPHLPNASSNHISLPHLVHTFTPFTPNLNYLIHLL